MKTRINFRAVSLLLLTAGIASMTFHSCRVPELTGTDSNFDTIRFNQLGYYPASVKEVVVADLEVEGFAVLDEEGRQVFGGNLRYAGRWEQSGEEIRTGDFSLLDKPGTYSIRLDNGLSSVPFQIRNDLYEEALNASVKSFYFQRASMPIEEQHGGIFQRAGGHEDLACPYHPSSGITEGTLDSPGGWYDAGDYGKYVVNAAISAGQMMNLLEIYPDAVGDGTLNIPESGNGLGDLLDEIRYELDWVLTMQDGDGGVFHKLTARNFSAFIMPNEYDLERLIIGKGTFSTLTFAAVMAQASRVFKESDPDWSSAVLEAAEEAWKWALAHDDAVFSNPEDVHTGEYGDSEFSDDFFWAAAELFLSTGKSTYEDYIRENEEPYIHQLTNSWKYYIRNMAFHSLIAHREDLNPVYAKSLHKKHLELADQILAAMDTVPYRIGLELFEWGSNSDILNQAQILCYAHLISGRERYLDGAVRQVDYIFGKNATGYSFLTGFGAKQVMHPHHRPSGADGIDQPVPGFVIGGPNGNMDDRRYVDYSSDYPAKAFEDVQPSYASNEVCLNWNAPAVFVLGYLEQVYSPDK